MTATERKYTISELQAGLNDERVRRSLDLALRDQAIRRFRRRGNTRVEDVVRELAEEYYLSEERVRSIVYKKGSGM